MRKQGGPKGNDSKFSPSCHGYAGISILEVASGKILHTIGEPDADYDSIAFCPNGRLVATAHRANLEVLDLKNRKTQFQFDSKDVIRHTVFSPDGKSLAWLNRDGIICLAEVSSGKLRRQYPPEKWGVNWRLVFSPCGRLLVVHRNDEFQKRDAVWQYICFKKNTNKVANRSFYRVHPWLIRRIQF